VVSQVAQWSYYRLDNSQISQIVEMFDVKLISDNRSKCDF